MNQPVSIGITYLRLMAKNLQFVKSLHKVLQTLITNMGGETVNVQVAGIQYSIPSNRYETESNKYEIAWNVARNAPRDKKTFLSTYSLARVKQSQQVLGCDYDKDTQRRVLQAFKT